MAKLKGEIEGGNRFSKRNFTNGLILIAFLIPLNYALFVSLKPSLPSPDSNAASNAQTLQVNYNTYIGVGLSMYNNGNYPEALKAWQKAFELNPKSELACNNIGAAYGKMGNWEMQKKYCEIALSINPGFELAKTNLLQANEELKKIGK